MLCGVPLGSLCVQILGFPAICLRHKTGSLGVLLSPRELTSSDTPLPRVRRGDNGVRGLKVLPWQREGGVRGCNSRLMCLLVDRTGLAPLIISHAHPPPSGRALLGWYRWASSHGAFASAAQALEVKFDGYREQVHKMGTSACPSAGQPQFPGRISLYRSEL